MRIGREREHGVVNSLSVADVETVCATLEFFGVDGARIQQTTLDLRLSRYRVFDWLAMNLDHEINTKDSAVEDESNIWIALGVTYSNTSAVKQFINSLRYNDYQLWEGKFTSKEFVEYLREWDKDDVENELRLTKQAKVLRG